MKKRVFSRHLIFFWSIIFATGIATSAFAEGVTIPHTFIAGDTARASEVNENFTAIETAVNDNYSRITTNTSDIVSNTTRITTNEGTINDLANRSWEKSGNDLYYNNGNVGIGTTTPEEELHIAGYSSDAITDERPRIHLENLNTSGDNGAAIRFKGRNAYYTIGIDTNWDGSNNFYLFDATVREKRILVDSSGNVGIGTTSPNGTLDVNGSIYQRGSQLHADYVFEREYKLESIEEHSKYMWEYKHLKAIPKAKVEENGQEIVEVGAYRRGIVEELEKAHIYIEQLHKRINEMEGLKAENGDLKILVSELLTRIEALENNN